VVSQNSFGPIILQLDPNLLIDLNEIAELIVENPRTDKASCNLTKDLALNVEPISVFPSPKTKNPFEQPD
jgi:hypothetical protein